ncbi:MAG: gamma-glutamylcyclotransferase [Gammaproteobacteria bacterium]|nr:gamma-glutamylcyclotransferase [Gammaproteobacteria bacterium]
MAYGSNLHPGRLRDRVPTAELCGATTIAGWRLEWHKRSYDGSAKCSIVRATGNSLLCVAVYEFERDHLHLLDTAEGLGNGYEHFELNVTGFGTCLTYRAQTTHIDETLKPYEWYKEFVLLGCEHHGFDGPYLEEIRTVTHCDDPEPNRHSRHMARIAQLQSGQRSS